MQVEAIGTVSGARRKAQPSDSLRSRNRYIDMARKSRPYEVGLHERLRNRAHAASYINAAAEDSVEGFLLALRDVAESTKGMSKVAETADKNRENLYRMLSRDGNPRLSSPW